MSAEASLSLLVSSASHTVFIPPGAVLGCFGPKSKESTVAFPLFCPLLAFGEAAAPPLGRELGPEVGVWGSAPGADP